MLQNAGFCQVEAAVVDKEPETPQFQTLLAVANKLRLSQSHSAPPQSGCCYFVEPVARPRAAQYQNLNSGQSAA